MKVILNCMLYVTQWLHLRMGGTIGVARDRVILFAPKGRSWFATEKAVEKKLKRLDL